MTQGEKMVWASAYAIEYMGQQKDRAGLGIKPSVETAVELAWAAVFYLRKSRDAVKDGWGDDFEGLEMLDEMIAEPEGDK